MKFDLGKPVNVDGITFEGSFEVTDPYFSMRIQEETEKQKDQETETEPEPELESETEMAEEPPESAMTGEQPEPKSAAKPKTHEEETKRTIQEETKRTIQEEETSKPKGQEETDAPSDTGRSEVKGGSSTK
jgi:hypothetical protein